MLNAVKMLDHYANITIVHRQKPHILIFTWIPSSFFWSLCKIIWMHIHYFTFFADVARYFDTSFLLCYFYYPSSFSHWGFCINVVAYLQFLNAWPLDYMTVMKLGRRASVNLLPMSFGWYLSYTGRPKSIVVQSIEPELVSRVSSWKNVTLPLSVFTFNYRPLAKRMKALIFMRFFLLLCTCRSVSRSVSLNIVQLITQQRFTPSNLVHG